MTVRALMARALAIYRKWRKNIHGIVSQLLWRQSQTEQRMCSHSFGVKPETEHSSYARSLGRKGFFSVTSPREGQIAHFQKEWQTGAKMGARSIMGSFGGAIARAKAFSLTQVKFQFNNEQKFKYCVTLKGIKILKQKG